MTRTHDKPAEELISLTGVSPREALAAARPLLATGPGPRDASIAHQAAAIVLRDFGDVRAAIREFRLAARLARAAAEPDREADVLTSLGTALVMSGRTGAGLVALDQALARVASGAARGRVLLAGGLHGDARAGVEAGRAGRITATKRAELMLAAARTALAAGRPGQAAERAVMSRSMFATQQREWWRTHATLVLLQARLAAGRPPGRLLAEAIRTAGRLDELRSDEAPDAWLLAGRIALAAGPRIPAAEASRLLACAARAARRRVPAFARAAGSLAVALQAEQAGDRRRLLAACGRGFGLLEEHLGTLGGAELRAHATAHGAELAGLAQRAALRSGRPRLLLEWSERWRAVTFAAPGGIGGVVPPGTSSALPPPGDPAARAELAALRDVTARLERAEPGGFPATVLHRERLRLEAAVRRRTLRSAPGRGGAAARFDAGDLLDQLGPGRLLELVVADGDLHVLVCGDGRIRRLAARAAAEAARELDFARFGLSRIARGGLDPKTPQGPVTEPAEQALEIGRA